MEKEVLIEYLDAKLRVVGVYEEGESGVMYHSDMSGTPPTPSVFKAEYIYAEDSEINLYNLVDVEAIEDICLNKIED